MKNNFYFALILSLLLVGCGTSNRQVLVEQPATLPVLAKTPEIAVVPVAADSPATLDLRPTPEKIRDAVTIGDNASLRIAGNTESEVIDTIPEGAGIEVLRQKGAWFFVRVDEKTGWMHGDMFRFGEKAEEFEIVADVDSEPVYVQPPPYISVPFYRTPAPTPRPDDSSPQVYDDVRNYRSSNEGVSESENSTDRIEQSTLTVTPSVRRPVPSSAPDYVPSYVPTTPGVESVRGYTRKNGTYVAPYVRTRRDSTTLNNFSTKGNVNPYTGKRGSRKP